MQAQYIPGMPQAFGQHHVSFGSITPSMAAAPAYFQPVPAAPFVPGPAHHTLHANAHEFVRSLYPLLSPAQLHTDNVTMFRARMQQQQGRYSTNSA